MISPSTKFHITAGTVAVGEGEKKYTCSHLRVFIKPLMQIEHNGIMRTLRPVLNGVKS